jgi:hypothetical protein
MALMGDLQTLAFLKANVWVEVVGPRRRKKMWFANYNASPAKIILRRNAGDATNPRGIVLQQAAGVGTSTNNTFTDAAPAHQGRWFAITDTAGSVLDYAEWV